MSLDYAILGFLAEQPSTGYDLKTRCFDATLDGLWPADQAQIYRTLDRLSRSKLIHGRRRRRSGRPDRYVYEITPQGLWTLESWITESTSPPVWRDPLHIQLYFGAASPDSSIEHTLSARREVHQARLDNLRQRGRRLGAESESPRTALLRQAAFDGAAALERATIDWLDDCIEAVQEGALPGSEKGIGQRHLFGSEPA